MQGAPALVQDESLCTRTLREVREYQAGAAARQEEEEKKQAEAEEFKARAQQLIIETDNASAKLDGVKKDLKQNIDTAARQAMNDLKGFSPKQIEAMMKTAEASAVKNAQTNSRISPKNATGATGAAATMNAALQRANN